MARNNEPVDEGLVRKPAERVAVHDAALGVQSTLLLQQLADALVSIVDGPQRETHSHARHHSQCATLADTPARETHPRVRLDGGHTHTARTGETRGAQSASRVERRCPRAREAVKTE